MKRPDSEALLRFPMVHERIDGLVTKMRTISCSRCGAGGVTKDSSAHIMANVVIERRFRDLGWSVAPRAGRDICPVCSAPARKPKPQEKTTVSDTPARADPAAQHPPQSMAAASPREPTIADRRKIMDALDAFYDIKAGRYVDDHTDLKIAERVVGMPRKWVSDLRDQLYGPERNEAAEKRDDAINKLDGRITGLEASIERSLGEWSALASELRAEVARIKR